MNEIEVEEPGDGEMQQRVAQHIQSHSEVKLSGIEQGGNSRSRLSQPSTVWYSVHSATLIWSHATNNIFEENRILSKLGTAQGAARPRFPTILACAGGQTNESPRRGGGML